MIDKIIKEYDVTVILDDRFYSEVIECDRVRINEGAYVFSVYASRIGADYDTDFAWYPVQCTIVRELKP